MDWCRKHVCELAVLCKQCAADSLLSEAQRLAFFEAYAHAKYHSSLPAAGGAYQVEKVIDLVCAACRDAVGVECSGRADWRQLCRLMQERMSGR
jgi:hypothetical protein